MARVYSEIRSGLDTLTDPLPLQQQPAMVGESVLTRISSRRAGANALNSAFRFTGQPVDHSTQDRIVIEAENSGGTVLATWRQDVSPWRKLSGRSPGQSLTDGTNAITVRSSAGTILLGRTDGNRILVQKGTFDTTSLHRVKAYTESHGDGLVQRRLDAIRDTNSRTIQLRSRAAVQPADPVGVTTEDGVTPQIPDAIEDIWFLPDAIPEGATGSIWVTEAGTTYDDVTGTWSVGAWTTTQQASGFDIQFAPDLIDGPWGEDGGWPQAWMRWRDSNGNYQYAEHRRAQVGWQKVFHARLGERGFVALPLGPYDVSAPRELVFEGLLVDSHRLVRVPQHLLRTGFSDDEQSNSSNSINCRFGRHGSGVSVGHGQIDPDNSRAGRTNWPLASSFDNVYARLAFIASPTRSSDGDEWTASNGGRIANYLSYITTNRFFTFTLTIWEVR